MQRKPYKQSGVTAEEFVRAWETSSTLDEVEARTGLNRNRAYSRRALYVKMGIKLKALAHRPRRQRLNVDALNALIAQLATEEK